jgi:3-deoxy-manno-octulosonate cytidylyltransferase (CMP-KDO synthetase)
MQLPFVRKILGIIAYRKDFLLDLMTLPPSRVEQAELIEQMRIIENGFSLKSVPVSPSLPSVNEPEESEIVLNYLKSNEEQRRILDLVMK